MKPILLLIQLSLLLMILSSPAQAQIFYNNGAVIKINAGELLTVNGSLENDAIGTIDNLGTIAVNGNWMNQNPGGGLNPGLGVVELNGSIQSIGGNQLTTFHDLNLTGTPNSRKILLLNTQVNGILSLGNDQLDLNENTIEITSTSPSAIIRNVGGHIKSESYSLVTPNTGNNSSIVKWKLPTAAANYIFPFGKGFDDANEYIPFTFDKQVSTTPVSLSVSTRNTLLANIPWPDKTDPVGTGIINPVTYLPLDGGLYLIDRWWDIYADAAVTADLTFTYAYGENTLDAAYQTGSLKAQHWNGSTWDAQVGTGVGTAIGTGTVTVAGATDFSPWVLAAEKICDIKLELSSSESSICPEQSVTLSTVVTNPIGSVTYIWNDPSIPGTAGPHILNPSTSTI